MSKNQSINNEANLTKYFSLLGRERDLKQKLLQLYNKKIENDSANKKEIDRLTKILGKKQANLEALKEQETTKSGIETTQAIKIQALNTEIASLKTKLKAGDRELASYRKAYSLLESEAQTNVEKLRIRSARELSYIKTNDLLRSQSATKDKRLEVTSKQLDSYRKENNLLKSETKKIIEQLKINSELLHQYREENSLSDKASGSVTEISSLLNLLQNPKVSELEETVIGGNELDKVLLKDGVSIFSEVMVWISSEMEKLVQLISADIGIEEQDYLLEYHEPLNTYDSLLKKIKFILSVIQQEENLELSAEDKREIKSLSEKNSVLQTRVSALISELESIQKPAVKLATGQRVTSETTIEPLVTIEEEVPTFVLESNLKVKEQKERKIKAGIPVLLMPENKVKELLLDELDSSEN
jgi:hypothetical protein